MNLRSILFAGLALLHGALCGAPLANEWKAVAKALDDKQPQTALPLLKPLETAAFKRKAWGDGAKALLIRVRLENGLGWEGTLDGSLSAGRNQAEHDPFAATDPFAAADPDEEKPPAGLPGCVRQLEREIPAAPEPVRPLLRWAQARWLHAYAFRVAEQSGSYDFWHAPNPAHAATPGRDAEPIESWNFPRLMTETGKLYLRALEEKSLRTTPVAAFAKVLSPRGALGDALRPTLYDLVAHSALGFFEGFWLWRDAPDDPFRISPASPVLADAEVFLTWKPEPTREFSRHDHALRIYQDLLAFHRADAEPSAWLHCDLERLRWAGRVAKGAGSYDRRLAAIRAFIAAHPQHPLSADARQDEVVLLMMKDRVPDAHNVALAGAEAFPRHPFGRQLRAVVAEFEERALLLSTPTVWPPAGDDIAVTRKNFRQAWFRLYPRTWTPEANLAKQDESWKSEKGLKLLLKSKPVRAWDATFDDPAEYCNHTSEIAAPADLKPGEYLLVASDRKDFAKQGAIATVPITVSGLELALEQDSRDRADVAGLVVDTVTGAPVAEAKVEVWQKPESSDSKGIPAVDRKETRTDADGAFRVPLAAMPKGGKVLVQASSGDHRVHGDSRVGEPSRSTVETTKDTPERILFFTDRGIYRPGQTIQFKGILHTIRHGDGEPHAIPNREVTVTLTGPNGQKCGELKAVTNARGSFIGSFTAPTGALLGNFEIAAGKLGSTTVSVEEYKRPKFQLVLHPPEQPAEVGGKVVVKGAATAFTGAPMDGAKVEWRIEREAFYTGRGAWLHGWGGQGTEHHVTGTAVTGADGSFAIEFIAEPDDGMDEALDPAYAFNLQVTVTDPTGETREDTISVYTGKTMFSASVFAKAWQEVGKPVVIEVDTQTHDGVGYPAAGTLRVYQLKQAAVCPKDESGSSGHLIFGRSSETADWETTDKVWEGPVATQMDEDGNAVAKPEVPLPAGCYRAEFEAMDLRGNQVIDLTDIEVLDPQADRLAIVVPFRVATPETSCEVGQPYKLLWGSGLGSARACVEWVHEGKLLKREWTVPGRTQQVLTFTPDASLRGGFRVRVRQFTGNRYWDFTSAIDVPWPRHDLYLEWEHFTSKLAPGAAETWSLVVTGTDGNPAPAEMVATLYDASLDELGRSANFDDFQGLSPTQSYWGFPRIEFSGRSGSGSGTARSKHRTSGQLVAPFRNLLSALDGAPSVTGLSFRNNDRSADFGERHGMSLLDDNELAGYSSPELPNSVGGTGGASGAGGFPVTPATPSSMPGPDDARYEAERRALAAIPSRKQLQETAFFQPQLTAGDDGKIRISFTMPEGLGRWRFRGFAHDEKLRSDGIDAEAVTTKDLMVQPNPPRFLREGDTLDFTVRVTNRSDREQTGLARLTLSDAATGRDLTESLGVTAPDQPITIPAQQSRTVAWRLSVPDGTGFLTYKAVATAGNLSDGEEAWLPVLPRKELVTDSLALRVRGPGTAEGVLETLRDSGGSATLRHHSLQASVVSNPAWYAVMALPYLMEFPHECSEQTFHRYYANALGHHLANADPRVREVFEAWRKSGALTSKLPRNAEVSNLMLEETPWLLDAAAETATRQQAGRLFDEPRMSEELKRTLAKLGEMQGESGLWPWFKGGPECASMSAVIVAGFGRLRALGVDTDASLAIDALAALDGDLAETHRNILKAGKPNDNHLDPWVAQRLYARSFFLDDRPLEGSRLEAHQYFTGQAKQHWRTLTDRGAAAQLALALWRDGDTETPKLITRAFRETARNHPQGGMSWPAVAGGGWWLWDDPVTTQAMMIEAFAEINRDAKAVEDCRVWLIQQLRGDRWSSTLATGMAAQALLAEPPSGVAAGNTLPPLFSTAAPARLELGGAAVVPTAVEPGTGRYEHRIAGDAVTPAMARVFLTKEDPGIAWASIHWRYFEDTEKLAARGSGGMSLEKSLWVRRQTPQGEQLVPLAGPVRVGEEIVTRLVVRTTRDLEFVHLKNARGSGLEPLGVHSGYRWEEGVGCYCVTRDAADHRFIDHLAAGTHVFEDRARVQHAGIYPCGVAEVRCLYAPESAARTASVRIEAVR
jgi:protocatechuate 3,4-dioxygenase beta subunit